MTPYGISWWHNSEQTPLFQLTPLVLFGTRIEHQYHTSASLLFYIAQDWTFLQTAESRKCLHTEYLLLVAGSCSQLKGWNKINQNRQMNLTYNFSPELLVSTISILSSILSWPRSLTVLLIKPFVYCSGRINTVCMAYNKRQSLLVVCGSYLVCVFPITRPFHRPGLHTGPSPQAKGQPQAFGFI